MLGAESQSRRTRRRREPEEEKEATPITTNEATVAAVEESAAAATTPASSHPPPPPPVQLTSTTLREALEAYYYVVHLDDRNHSTYAEYRELLDTLPADIGAWDVSTVTDFGGLFNRWRGPVPDIARWDVHNATTMFGMFYAADVSQLGDIGSSWRVDNVIDFRSMFYESNIQSSFPCARNLGSWRVTAARTMRAMFMNARGYDGAGLENWGQSTAAVEDVALMFAYTLVERSFRSWDGSSIKCASFMFYGTVPGMPARRIPANFLPLLRKGTIVSDFRQTTERDKEMYDDAEDEFGTNHLPTWRLAEMDPYLDVSHDPEPIYLLPQWIARYRGDDAWSFFDPGSQTHSLRLLYTLTAFERILAPVKGGGARSLRRRRRRL